MFGYFSLNTEIFLCIGVLFILLISVILQEKLIKFHYKLNLNKIVNNFTILILLLSGLILFHNMHYEAILINYQIICDKLGYFGKYFILLMSSLYFIVSSDYYEYEKIKNFEHILLLLLAIIGIFSIISSYDLITMYLSIELQSLCFYIVTNIKYYSNFSIEAGLKYFILGALSSGILLFGCSLIYGFTGMTNFSDLMVLFYYYNLEDFVLYYYKFVLIGLICLYSALLFKIGVVPFHM
jgi:NADH-quinone oxidoreductase subunit N